MSNKKRYRIRKAKNGEQVGVVNPMQQFMQKAAQGMQQPSPEQMAMMQQEQMLQQQSASQSENQVMQAIAQGMQQGISPQEIIAKLIQGGVPPNEVAEGFLQVTALKAQESGKQLSPEEGQALQAQVQELVSSVMQQMQAMQQQEQPSEEEMIAMQEQEQMAQAPQMTKGGFKKQLLDEAREGREMQTETPGSILPQPVTLNKFIEGVKNEGNEFYAKEMTNAADSAGMFRRGGDTSFWSDRKYARKASKKDPYERRDRRALRRGLKQGAFGRDDIDSSFSSGKSLLPKNYSNRDFRDIYKDLGTMGADFASTFMPQVFSHRNTDDEFSRNGTGLEDTNVPIYFKRKPFGRREWSISGLDYKSLPAYGGRGNYNADGTYAPYGTRTQTTYSRGVEGVRTIANEINNINDDTDNPLIERDASISGPVDPIMNYQNDPEGMFSDPSNDPLKQFTDPVNPALSEAAQAEAQARAEAEARAEEARLYEQQMLEKQAQGVIDNPSDGSGMSMLEQLDYLKSQGHTSADLTPTYTDEEMPEENEKTVEEYKAKQKQKSASNQKETEFVQKWNEDGSAANFKWNTQENQKKAEGNLQEWKKNEENLDSTYNAMHTATNSELAELATRKDERTEYWYDSYADMIDEISRNNLMHAFEYDHKPYDEFGSMPITSKADVGKMLYMVERYKNASAAEKAELEKKFKRARELPGKNEAKSKAKSNAARKKAYTVDAAKKYFTDRFPDYKKNPRKYKITKVGEGVYSLDGVDGGSFMRYEPRLDKYRTGGAVHPDLYDYVYGGEDEMDPDQFKDVTGAYFAPGGAFKKPKIDPALGMRSPSQEVQDYRENVYPTSKGIFGQVGDHLKSMVSPITQGQGLKGAFNAAGQAFAPVKFNWFSQNKYGKKNALGYIGVDGLSNTIVRPWDKDSLYYNNEAGYNTNNTGERAVGKYTNLDYKKKPFRKGKLTVTDSPVQTDREGNVVEGSNMGFLDMHKGTEFPLPGNKPKIAFGGETLNKYVMAGETDENFMQDQESPDLNLVQNKKPDFDFSNCPEGWETDPTTECYKKSMEMGTDENEYKVNKARTINAPLIDMAADKTADFIVDASTAVNNAKKFQHGFNTDAFADAKAKQVSYDTGQGWDAVTGYQSMVDSQFNEPVRFSSARPRGMNQFAARGGQYAVGGVYDLTPQQIDAIYAAGGSIEIIE